MKILRVFVFFVAVLVSTITVTAQSKTTPTPVASDETTTPNITSDFTVANGVESEWDAAVEELEELGLIEGDGELLFTSEMAIEALGGAGSAESTYVNYVMGALISVRTFPDGTKGVCTFITRGMTNRQGGIEQGIGVVITSEDDILALELTPEQATPRRLVVEYPERGNATFYNPQYVLVLINNNTLTLWVNGEVYIDAWELENELPDDHYENEVMTTINPEPGCVMTGLWAYGF